MTEPRIDAHQHFWRYDPAQYGWIDGSMAALRRDVMPEESAREMARAGFHACVAVQARQTFAETEWLLSLAGRHAFIAGVIGWVDLRADDARTWLKKAASNRRLVGVRHIVQSEPEDRFLLDPAFCRGIGLLEEFGLSYDILIYPRHLAVAAEFVARFPRQPFVLDHLAKPDIRSGRLDGWERDLRELAQFRNVWCKLSGLVTEADWNSWRSEQLRPCLDVAFDCFGPERLMIGSDWPVCTVAADYVRTIGVVLEYLSGRPREQQIAVLGRNAQKFWRLELEACTSRTGV
jgi:L-fuconolactonase